MAYLTLNPKTKKEAKELLKKHGSLQVFQPGGIFPLDTSRGEVSLEGPHFPEPHRWYGIGILDENNNVVKIT